MATEKTPTDRLVKVEEAARFLGYTPRYTRAMANRGVIPSEKLPTGALRFRISALDAWVKGRDTEPAAEGVA